MTLNSETDGVGLLRASKARHAEEAIRHSEGLFAVLRLTQADLEPAEDALRIAKDLFRAHEFSDAAVAARQAENLAIRLDERHAGYEKARKSLEIRINELQRLGLGTEEYETTLARAMEKAGTGVQENGVAVPNYLEARVLLERAAEEGLDLLMKANAASNRIFLAEVAIESLSDTEGLKNPKAFAEGALTALERSLEDATRELAIGHIEEAARIAAEIESRAERLRATYREVDNVLGSLDAHLRRLQGDGVVTGPIDRQMRYARDMQSKGLLEPTLAMARRLTEDATRLAEAHAKALTELQDAELVYARLVPEGFHSYDADAALKDARRALKEGNYARTIEHAGRAHAAFVRRRNAREALERALVETQKRIELLSKAEFPMLSDVEEMLNRAEREFRQGNYSGSSEDLQIATALLGNHPKPESPAR